MDVLTTTEGQKDLPRYLGRVCGNSKMMKRQLRESELSGGRQLLAMATMGGVWVALWMRVV